MRNHVSIKINVLSGFKYFQGNNFIYFNEIMDYYSIIKQENYFAYSHEIFDKVKRYIRSLIGCFIKKISQYQKV